MEHQPKPERHLRKRSAEQLNTPESTAEQSETVEVSADDQAERLRKAQELLEEQLRYEQDPAERARLRAIAASVAADNRSVATDSPATSDDAADLTPEARAIRQYHTEQTIKDQRHRRKLNILLGGVLVVLALILGLVAFGY